MGMDIVAVRAGLAANAATIAGLTCTAYAPDAVAVPAFFPIEIAIAFDESNNRTTDAAAVTCRLLVSSADDRDGQQALDAYLSGVAGGLKEALESEPTLGGACDWTVLTHIDGYGRYSVADAIYYGVTVHVEVQG